MPAPLLQLDKVTIRFGGLTAVNAVDFSVGENELCGLIGPNGAGKTTVFNLITGVYQPTEGAVTLAGRPVAGLRVNEIVELGIARTFQNIRLFGSLSVFDNVRVACNLHRATHPVQALVRLGAFRADEAAITKRAEELLDIFNVIASGYKITLNDEVIKAIEKYFDEVKPSGEMGNARYVRNLFEKMYLNLSNRAASDGNIELHELVEFGVEDIPAPDGVKKPTIGF